MNKTKIEWTDYTWNPITGCLNSCKFCYARKIYHRFKKSFKPEFHYDRLDEPLKIKNPSKIFVCSVSDFWGKGTKQIWRNKIYNTIMACPEHIFQILTKQPQNVIDIDRIPENVWIGQTIINRYDYKEIDGNNLKFISFEPLLNNEIGNYRFPADWYIIGGLTPKPKHTIQGVNLILSQACYFGIPVFMKNNLKPIWKEKLKQEFPNIVTRNLRCSN